MQSNADFCALIVTLVLLPGSWLWESKRWLGRDQKNRADAYNHQIIALYNRADVSSSVDDLAGIRQQLMTILTASVTDLDEDRISGESFQSLRVIWQITVDAVREKHAMLEAESSSL